ncbi:ABC transporter permease, partial [Aeromonas veronii]
MLFNPIPSILRLVFALLGLALQATYGWILSHQDVPMDLLARQHPPSQT